MHKAAIGGKLPTLSMTWLRMMTTSLLSIGYQYSSHNASFVQNVTVQVYITGVYDPLYDILDRQLCRQTVRRRRQRFCFMADVW